MDGPAAAPELEMRLGVDSCTLGPFPVPRLGGGAGGAERIVLLDALMCVTQQAAGGSCYVWVRPSMRRKSAAEDDRTSTCTCRELSLLLWGGSRGKSTLTHG